jgi:hypothetical protein
MSSDDRPDDSDVDDDTTDGTSSASGDDGGTDPGPGDDATTSEEDAGGGGGANGPTLAERRAVTRPSRRQRRDEQKPWLRMALRYGPFLAVAVLVVAAVAIFGGGDDEEGGDDGGGGLELTTDAAELMARGPMSWQRAEDEGADVEWGPNCDTERGTIRIPSVYAPPCVEPFTGDNGGDTATGVTGDEILVIQYFTNPELDPLGASIVGGAGADTNPETNFQALEDYAAVYNQVFELYGRQVRLENFIGSGASDDRDAAREDARRIAARHPFAVLGGPLQSTAVFAQELAANGVVCGPTCSLAEPEAIVENPDYNPYIWLPGPTPDQAALATVEMVANLAGPGPAELAGDPEMQSEDRVYGVVHYDTPDNVHEEVFQTLQDGLEGQGIEVATDVRFELNLSRAQDNARTIISRLKDAGVTTVIYYGDPFTIGTLTTEASEQDYQPEWIGGPTVLGDSIFFGRMNDGDQWSHGFSLGILGANTSTEITESYHIYQWAYGREAPNNTVVVSEPPLRNLFSALQMAGPDLTPETLRDGQFRLPPRGGGPANPTASRGDHDLWPDDSGVDWGSFDDFAILWWDPQAVGEDELGARGDGMYRYANEGERYRLGEFPQSLEEAGLFDSASAPTILEELPPEDALPDYEPPEGFGG